MGLTLHRYTLTRTTPFEGDMLETRQPKVIGWVLCNPSTATDDTDDATIRRVISFSDREKATAIIVTNIVPFRATNPARLDNLSVADAFGDDDLQKQALEHLFYNADLIIFAWGALCTTKRRHKLFVAGLELLGSAYRIDTGKVPPPLFHLGLSSSGHPKHPLYLAKETPLQGFWATDLAEYIGKERNK